MFVTGSTDMIDQLISDPDITDSLCLIYIAGPGYGMIDYFSLELDRNKDKSLSELKQSAQARYENSINVASYFQRNYDFFDYAMLNIPPKTGDRKTRELADQLYKEFYKAIIANNHQPGPCWIANINTNRRTRQ